MDLVTELVDYFKPSTDFSPVQPNYKTLHHKYGKLYKEHPDHEIWSYHGEPGKSSSAHLKTEL